MKFSPDDILELVLSIHSKKEDFEEGDLEERIFRASEYELTTACPQFIDDEFYTDDEIVDTYSKMNPKDCPPIVLIKYSDSIYSIIDGSHRIAAFKKAGFTVIPAYIGDATNWSPEEDDE